MNTAFLSNEIREKGSFLCVGIDPVPELLPEHLKGQKDALIHFCIAIVDATAPHCVAFKPNLAFFEAYGLAGWQALEQLIGYIKENYPNHFTIADAKRGDIGNTAKAYAKAFFEVLNFDAITLSPYMGAETIEPYLAYEGKTAIVLALTSNKGAFDFQWNEDGREPHLAEKVVAKTQELASSDRIMYVVGATQDAQIRALRALAPDSFFLMPGIGAQGGSLTAAFDAAKTKDVGLIVNSSRGIIYASARSDFAEVAAQEAHRLHQQMQTLLYI
jgi:orotidine-5'-phosphate decarboxylase